MPLNARRAQRPLCYRHPAGATIPRLAGAPMRRREFITLIGGAAAWPLVARAQQPERMRLIGVLLPYRDNDPEGHGRFDKFRQSLHQLGWIDGHNVRIDHRWAGDDNAIRTYALELARIAPDVVVGASTPVLHALQQHMPSAPIVFVGVSDPEGVGFIASLARPGGNVTGFANFEAQTGGKWLQSLKDLVPRLDRVAVLRNPAAGDGFVRTIETVAPALGVEVIVAGVRDRAEILRAIDGFAGRPNGGLIVLPDPIFQAQRGVIINAAAKHQLPAVYPFRIFATDGGLMAYAVDPGDQLRRAASYVGRILKGEKPADLPVQAPTKYELAINLKTAKALGLEIPPSLLARADEVIE